MLRLLVILTINRILIGHITINQIQIVIIPIKESFTLLLRFFLGVFVLPYKPTTERDKIGVFLVAFSAGIWVFLL